MGKTVSEAKRSAKKAKNAKNSSKSVGTSSKSRSSCKSQASKGRISKPKAGASGLSFPVFGDVLEVSDGRAEYNRLRTRFSDLAREEYAKAKKEIEKYADDIVSLCENGDEWAGGYFEAAADLAVEELMSKGCYDVDRDTFISEYLDTSLWDKRLKAVVEAVAAVAEEEEERESERAARTEAAGSAWEGGGFGLRGAIKGAAQAEALNLAGSAVSGVFNMIGRNMSARENEERLNEIFEDNKDELAWGIYITIKTSVDELVECLEKSVKSVIADVVTAEDRRKAERLFNNLKTGKLPSAADHAARMDILSLNPYQTSFYEHIFASEGDASGELGRVAEYFGVSLEGVKEDSFKQRLGKCSFSTEDETMEYRKKAVSLGKELALDVSRTLAKIDLKLKAFDEEARTVEGRIFETRGEAEKQRELAEYEKSLDLSTEESAIAARKLLQKKMSGLKIDGEWQLKRVEKALKKFDEEARTTFGLICKTRDEAVQARSDRSLFYKGVEKLASEFDFYVGDEIPEKKVVNSRAVFPIPADEYIIALTDTTLFGTAKTGLALTHWGLRWRNDGSSPSNVVFLSWQEFAELAEMPKSNDDSFVFFDGAVYANGGSNVDSKQMRRVFSLLRSFCETATFFVKRTDSDRRAEESLLTTRQKMERLCIPITDKDFLFGTRISAEKAEKARKSCQLADDDNLLVVIDATFFGSCAAALVLSDKGVSWRNKNSPVDFVPWKDIPGLDKSIKVVDDGDRLAFAQGRGFHRGSANVDLQKIAGLISEIGKIASEIGSE